MTRSFAVNSQTNDYQSPYPKFPSRVSAFLRSDAVRSMPNPTAPDGADDAETPWDIKNVEQLKRWVEKDPDRVLEFLNELRRQRDLGIEACELFDIIPGEKIWKARYEEIDRAFTLFKKNSQKLQDKLTELQSQLRVARAVTPSASTFSSSTKRSWKFPHPPVFTDGTEPTWEDWQGKICDKLSISSDHFDSERTIQAYIFSRLSGDAAEFTLRRHQRGSLNPYSRADDLPDDLAEGQIGDVPASYMSSFQM